MYNARPICYYCCCVIGGGGVGVGVGVVVDVGWRWCCFSNFSLRLFNRRSFSTASSTTATSSSFSPSARLAGCVRLDARNTHARARTTLLQRRLARFQTRTRFADGKSMARPFQPRYASRTVYIFFFFLFLSLLFVVVFLSLSITAYIPSTVSRSVPLRSSFSPSPFDDFPVCISSASASARARARARVRISMCLTSNFTCPFAHNASFFSSISLFSSSLSMVFHSNSIPRVCLSLSLSISISLSLSLARAIP